MHGRNYDHCVIKPNLESIVLSHSPTKCAAYSLLIIVEIGREKKRLYFEIFQVPNWV